MGVWKRKQEWTAVMPMPTQLRSGQSHPFRMLEGYVPLSDPAFALYRAIREAVPVVDAAILKLIRMSGGLSAACPNARAEAGLNHFLKTVPCGWNQTGIQAFLDAYLDSLLTCGRAVGEIVLTRAGDKIAAVLCGNVAEVEIAEEGAPLKLTLGQRTDGQGFSPLPYQELLFFTPYYPSSENPYGVSLLRSMPFLANILLGIYQTLGANWERAGNLRYSVVYKPDGELDANRAGERSATLASEWSKAMEDTKSGAVRDFVCVGDVAIKVIGAEAQIPDCQVPVRLIVEQLIAKTGIPPFLLGLNWSSTERMSAQQADMMTSELTALRRTVSPPVEKLCALWLQLHGFDADFTLVWDDLNLQDEVEEARALLYREQARHLAIQNDKQKEESE